MDGGEPPLRPSSPSQGWACCSNSLALAEAGPSAATAGAMAMAPGGVAAADGGLDAQAEAPDGSLNAHEILPDAMSNALARSLVPIVPHPAREYNLPVNDVQRSQVDDMENMEKVDWATIEIVETHDDEGRIELMSETKMCELLGLTDEGTTNQPTQGFDSRMDEQGNDNELGLDIDDAAIPTSDVVPDVVPDIDDAEQGNDNDKALHTSNCRIKFIIDYFFLHTSNCRIEFMYSKLAMLLGEGTSSQTDDDTTSPVTIRTATAPKKMTPKRKLRIG